MDTAPIWDILKSIFSWIGLIASSVLGLMFRSYNKHKVQTNDHDIRITKLEVKVEGIKSDARETKEEFKEELKDIKAGVDKLVDHLLNKKK